MTSVQRARRRIPIAVAAASLLLALVTVPASSSDQRIPVRQDLPMEEDHLVRILVPGSAEVDELQQAGFDLAGNAQRVPAGIEVDAVLTAAQLDALDDFGAVLAADAPAVPEEAPAALDDTLAAEDADSVVIGRADWFTTKGQGFLSVEAKSSERQSAALVLSWPGGQTNMSTYVDSGQYMYHRVQVPVDQPRPDTITVTSSVGGEATATVTDWLFDTDADVDRPGYQYGFVDGYMDPTLVYQRFDELAALHPEVAEMVDLPYESNGYRRLAQAILQPTPSQNSRRVVVDSLVWGHEGGNDISVEVVDPAAPDQALAVTVTGNAIRVSLATDAAGATTSTAAQVVDALNAGAGSLVRAYTYRNNSGSGLVAPQAPTLLSDFLSAPEYVERDAFDIRALRIGLHRDGSQPGVLIIAEDHAREWVTPLVALEAAERLLANYKSDRTTRDILRNVDIFIIPSNNPDGSHYSFFDRSAQRRTMTNHCPLTGSADPLARGNWGVDLNRNYSVGSVFDGFTGASTSCTSDTFAGPAELSEPEAKNIVWLAENFDNLKFFMTVHSSGGQLFWQPGSYIAQGRITTPRPPLRDEQYYWYMAEDILSNVKALRDSVVQPRNVGGSADVLYSSAGNVREELYNNYGIYAFGWEIGGEQWNPDTRRFVSGGGFMPQWPEADQQYQEYASGVIKMFEIAKRWGDDREPATTHLLQERQRDRTVHVRFVQNEPALIYFTTDGSQPTTSSRTYQANNIREPGETIVIDETTTFRWFSVDVKGHVEPERTRTVNVR